MRDKKMHKHQQEALKAALSEKASLVTMCTGSGKTKVGIDYCKTIFKNKNSSSFKVLWIVPYEKLRDLTIRDEFYKWKGKTFYNEYVNTVCYSSLHKKKYHIYFNWDVIILDEAHKITDLSASVFDHIRYDNLLCLTATPPQEEVKKEIFDKLNIKHVYDLQLDDGVELGVVAPYTIHIVNVSLNSVDKNIKAGSKEKPFMTTEAEQYSYLSKNIRKIQWSLKTATNSQRIGLEKKLMFATLNRMRFLYNLPSKTAMAKKLLNKIPKDERTLVFTGSIKQSKDICGNNVFNSKSGNKYFDLFVNKDINILGVVKAVNEGHNLPDVDNAIIVQLDSNPRNAIQRIGRIVRKRPNHEATIYILVAEDTQDEVWMESALSSLDSNNIKYKIIK